MESVRTKTGNILNPAMIVLNIDANNMTETINNLFSEKKSIETLNDSVRVESLKTITICIKEIVKINIRTINAPPNTKG